MTTQPLRIAMLASTLLAGGMFLVACKDRVPVASTVGGASGDTSVLGAPGPDARPGVRPGVVTDAQGREIPPPPLPRQARAQVVASGPDTALAVWVQDGDVMAAGYTRGYGWSPAQVLERIYGDASDVQLASNGRGAAMAIWHHTVGSIDSLRFSRFEQGTGWSHPDVMPGALPRPQAQDAAPPQLAMDARGNAQASWPSGFAPDEMQTSRFVAGQGWSRAQGERLAAGPAAGASGMRSP
jgi:hypothetical protein